MLLNVWISTRTWVTYQRSNTLIKLVLHLPAFIRCLDWTISGIVHTVTIAIGSYVQLPWFVQKCHFLASGFYNDPIYLNYRTWRNQCVPNLNLLSLLASFMVLGCSMHVQEKKYNHQYCLAFHPVSYNMINLTRYAHFYNNDTNTIRVTNYFPIGFKACSII